MTNKKTKKNQQISSLASMSSKKTLWGDVLSRLMRNKMGLIGMSIIFILIILIVAAPVFARYPYAEQSFAERFEYPSLRHFFGTDNYGRDIWARILYGGRNSFMIALIATLISASAGILLGSSAGYFGGKTDLIISRVLDVFMAIPSLLLAIAVSTALGSGPINTAIAISISGIPSSSRIMRSTVMSIKSNEFVEAAKATGSNDFRVIFKHILPNTVAPLIINASLSIGHGIMSISGLSFIGLGVKPPTPEWGSILNTGREFIRDFWPMTVFPALFILLTIFTFNLVGDALRDALDPRLKD